MNIMKSSKVSVIGKYGTVGINHFIMNIFIYFFKILYIKAGKII